MKSRLLTAMVNRPLLFLFSMVLLLTASAAHQSQADSGLSLLAGFDSERVESVFPAADEKSSGELAKLVYRLQQVDSSSLDQRLGESSAVRLGDVVRVEGIVEEIQSIALPENLVEFLEMTALSQVSVTSDDRTTVLVTPLLEQPIKSGDRVGATGVVIEVTAANSEPVAVAASKLSWTPRTDKGNSTGVQGWDLLSKAGLDMSVVAELAARNRKPLMGQDGDAFYGMLSAAYEIGRIQDAPNPPTVEAVELLRNPERFGGQWLSMDVETAQITRISVTEPVRQAQLGSDHYFQIDAFGDLGNVVVRIEPNNVEASPAVFENRYPVSIVARELPPFLAAQVREQSGANWLVADTRMQIGVDAFFFRLWSYSTDYMDGLGAGDQFGPLLVAARFRNRESEIADSTAAIGWVAAAAVMLGIVAIWIWHRRTSAQDEQVRRKRQLREAKQLDLPSQ